MSITNMTIKTKLILLMVVAREEETAERAA